jgi:hypothetical protein
MKQRYVYSNIYIPNNMRYLKLHNIILYYSKSLSIHDDVYIYIFSGTGTQKLS